MAVHSIGLMSCNAADDVVQHFAASMCTSLSSRCMMISAKEMYLFKA